MYLVLLLIKVLFLDIVTEKLLYQYGTVHSFSSFAQLLFIQATVLKITLYTLHHQNENMQQTFLIH